MNLNNEQQILETINMIKLHHLDIRTVTMSLSLRDCISDDAERVYANVHNKIIKYAKNLYQYANELEDEHSIPIIDKRIAITPASILGESCNNFDYVKQNITKDTRIFLKASRSMKFERIIESL